MSKGFIEQTAKDYDMSFDDVLSIYRLWHNEGLFYEKLEQFIKNRSSN